MALVQEASIHLKTSFAQRNAFSGKLRMRGTNMQTFLSDVVALINADESFLDMIEQRRETLKGPCAHKALPDDTLIDASAD